jgi:hypothetical protein
MGIFGTKKYHLAALFNMLLSLRSAVEGNHWLLKEAFSKPIYCASLDAYHSCNSILSNSF